MKENGRPIVAEDGWPLASPDEKGLDPEPLNAIGARFGEWKEANVHAVVVARHGSLVYERYFSGDDWRWDKPIGTVAYGPAVRHDLRSITKSVTSLLVGVLAGRGAFSDIDVPVFAFFPEYADLRTPQKERITLRHLLTMSAGFAWDESLPYSNPANSERAMDDSADPYRFTLERHLAMPPGEVFNYCGGATTLLQGIIQKLSGQKLEVLAQEALFEPLGIADVEWVRFVSGDVIGLGGLRLRPRDLAKIGQLVLNRGIWGSVQVVPESWIEQATTSQIGAEGLFFYGLHWWLGRSLVGRREVRWVAGIGYGGQRLYIVPSLGIVMVFHAGLYNDPLSFSLGGSVLNRHVLPAVRR